jgi:hypothetical protein
MDYVFGSGGLRFASTTGYFLSALRAVEFALRDFDFDPGNQVHRFNKISPVCCVVQQLIIQRCLS